LRLGPSADAERRAEIHREHAAALVKDPSQVQEGVSITWLQPAFKMDLRTVKNRLGALKLIGGSKVSLFFQIHNVRVDNAISYGILTPGQPERLGHADLYSTGL
jgi:hypothetical protein